MRLRGRVALVTGAQQGIGRAIALAFARQGANLVVNYLDDRAAAETLVAAIEDAGARAQAVQGNVTSAAAIAAMVAAGDDLGGLDILVNNAGIFPRSGFLDLAEDEWDRVLDVNLKGAFLCAQAVARAMVAQGRSGAIVNIASVIAATGSAPGVHYTASKAGLVGFTRATALALAPHGIRVNAIAPGVADTAQPRDGMSEDEINAHGAALPLGRILTPEEVADAAVFLASDEARQITGQTLHVNGGHIFA
jgi:NAD(P)-dependent dehydrogenase (short-subunit alcohol dehydrogenase family)